MKNSLKVCVVMMAVLLVLSASACFATLVYVKTTGSDANSGLSWSLAKMTVQAGIDAAAAGDEVRVAAGMYGNITLKAGVAVYGGYAANGSTTRDWVTNVTTLRGSTSGAVVMVPSGAGASTMLDGFTVEGGSGVYFPDENASYGGGIYSVDASPTFANCCVQYNENGSSNPGYGAGAYFKNGSPVLVNVMIGGNISWCGGGILSDGANLTITGCRISGNSAYPPTYAACEGGGVVIGGGSLTMTNSVVDSNYANTGAGISAGGTVLAITNCVISNNCALVQDGWAGGGMIVYSCTGYLTNNTIVGNIAKYEAGGIFCSYSPLAISNNIIASNSQGIYVEGDAPTLRNNDFFDNTYAEWGSVSYEYSGIAAGQGDIAADPRFVDAASGNFHLSASSPCVNAGWNSALGLPSTDFDGQGRTNGTVDIGVDELWP